MGFILFYFWICLKFKQFVFLIYNGGEGVTHGLTLWIVEQSLTKGDGYGVYSKTLAW